MASTGEMLLQLLAEQGVDTVFGIPGNHTVELYRGFRAAGIRHLTSRHEQGAAFMADGYARATGRPGVCVLVSGPGLLNAATGIAQARADSVPMLVITGVAARADLGMGRGTLHELPDQGAAARSFCVRSHTLLDPANLADIVGQAFTLFRCARPGPVHLEIPLDLMGERAPAAATGALPSPPAADPAAIHAAATRLAAARQPLLLLGGGAVAAHDRVTDLAERLDAPVLNTVNGKGLVPMGHPLAVGGSPSLPALRKALSDADAVLAIGTELAETDYDLLMSGPLQLGDNLIRMDVDAAQVIRNARPGIGITADSACGVAALIDNLPAASPGSGIERAAALRAAVRAETHYHGEMAAFLDVLRGAHPDIVVMGDSTLPTYYAAWQYECSMPRSYSHSVSGFGTLGWALPAALGARIGVSRPVLAIVGDGGVQFTLPELGTGTAARLGVPVVIWNNGGYGEIETSMTARGVPADATRIAPPDFAAAARAHGCGHRRARSLEQLGAALTDALAAQAPTIIEVMHNDFISEPAGQWYT